MKWIDHIWSLMNLSFGVAQYFTIWIVIDFIIINFYVWNNVRTKAKIVSARIVPIIWKFGRVFAYNNTERGLFTSIYTVLFFLLSSISQGEFLELCTNSLQLYYFICLMSISTLEFLLFYFSVCDFYLEIYKREWVLVVDDFFFRLLLSKLKLQLNVCCSDRFWVVIDLLSLL